VTTTESEDQTLVTPEMLERKGVWGSVRVSPPVSDSDIRKWAIAVYWPETPPRIYWDAEYAATTRWGTIIAPPDFNPFAWPIVEAGPAAAKPSREHGDENQPGSAKGRRGMNGGQVDTYGVPMRPGDVITSRSRLRDWDERQTRLGLTLFTFSETEWRNQDEALVKVRVATGIRY
jgi:hypothetical protein